eukprot:gene24650-29784_t
MASESLDRVREVILRLVVADSEELRNIDLKDRIRKYLNSRKSSLRCDLTAEDFLSLLERSDIVIKINSEVLNSPRSAALALLSPLLFTQQTQELYNGLVDYEDYLVLCIFIKLPNHSWSNEMWNEWYRVHSVALELRRANIVEISRHCKDNMCSSADDNKESAVSPASEEGFVSMATLLTLHLAHQRAASATCILDTMFNPLCSYAYTCIPNPLEATVSSTKAFEASEGLEPLKLCLPYAWGDASKRVKDIHAACVGTGRLVYAYTNPVQEMVRHTMACLQQAQTQFNHTRRLEIRKEIDHLKFVLQHFSPSASSPNNDTAVNSVPPSPPIQSPPVSVQPPPLTMRRTLTNVPPPAANHLSLQRTPTTSIVTTIPRTFSLTMARRPSRDEVESGQGEVENTSSSLLSSYMRRMSGLFSPGGAGRSHSYSMSLALGNNAVNVSPDSRRREEIQRELERLESEYVQKILESERERLNQPEHRKWVSFRSDEERNNVYVQADRQAVLLMQVQRVCELYSEEDAADILERIQIYKHNKEAIMQLIKVVLERKQQPDLTKLSSPAPSPGPSPSPSPSITTNRKTLVVKADGENAFVDAVDEEAQLAFILTRLKCIETQTQAHGGISTVELMGMQRRVYEMYDGLLARYENFIGWVNQEKYRFQYVLKHIYGCSYNSSPVLVNRHIKLDDASSLYKVDRSVWDGQNYVLSNTQFQINIEASDPFMALDTRLHYLYKLFRKQDSASKREGVISQYRVSCLDQARKDAYGGVAEVQREWDERNRKRVETTSSGGWGDRGRSKSGVGEEKKVRPSMWGNSSNDLKAVWTDALVTTESEAKDLYVQTKASLDELEKMWRMVYVAQEMRVWRDAWTAAQLFDICPELWENLPTALKVQYNHAVQMRMKEKADQIVCDDAVDRCDESEVHDGHADDNDEAPDNGSDHSSGHSELDTSLQYTQQSYLEDDVAVYSGLVQVKVFHKLSACESSSQTHDTTSNSVKTECLKLFLTACQGIRETYAQIHLTSYLCKQNYGHTAQNMLFFTKLSVPTPTGTVGQDTMCLWVGAMGLLQKALSALNESEKSGSNSLFCKTYFRMAQALVLYTDAPSEWKDSINLHVETEYKYLLANQGAEHDDLSAQCVYLVGDSICRENNLLCSLSTIDQTTLASVRVAVSLQDIDEVCSRVNGMLTHSQHTQKEWYIEEAHSLLTLAFNAITADEATCDDACVLTCTNTLAYIYFKLAQLRLLQHMAFSSNNADIRDSTCILRLAQSIGILSGDLNYDRNHPNALDSCLRALSYARVATNASRQLSQIWLQGSAILLLQSSVVMIGETERATGLEECVSILIGSQLNLPSAATIILLKSTMLPAEDSNDANHRMLNSICDLYLQIRHLEVLQTLSVNSRLRLEYRAKASVVGSMTQTSALSCFIHIISTKKDEIAEAAWLKYIDSCFDLVSSAFFDQFSGFLSNYYRQSFPLSVLAHCYELEGYDFDYCALLRLSMSEKPGVDFRDHRCHRQLLATSDRTSFAAAHAHQGLLQTALEGCAHAAQLYGQAMLLYLISSNMFDDDGEQQKQVCVTVADSCMMAAWFSAQAHYARKQKKFLLSRANHHLAMVFEHLAELQLGGNAKAITEYKPVLTQLYCNLKSAIASNTQEPAEDPSRLLDFSASETPLQLLWWRYLYGSRSARLFFEFAEAFLFFPHDQTDYSTHPAEVVHTLCTMLLTRLQIKPCDTHVFLNANDYLRACRETCSGGDAINNEFVEARVVGWSLDPFASNNSVFCIKRFLLLLHCLRKLCSWTGNIQSILAAYGYEFFGLLSVLLRSMVGVLKPILGKGEDLEQRRLLEQHMLFSVQALLSMALGASTVPYLALRKDKMYGSSPYQFFQLFNEGLDPLLESYAVSNVEEQLEESSLVNFEPVIMLEDLAWNNAPLQSGDFCNLTSLTLIVWLQDLAVLSSMLVIAQDQHVDSEELGEVVLMLMKFVVVIQQDTLRSLSVIIQQEPSQLSLIKDMKVSSLILRYADPLDFNSLFQFVEFNHLVLERAMLTVMWFSACLQAGQGLAYAKSFIEETKALLASTTSLFSFSMAVVESDMRQRDVVMYLLQHTCHYPIYSVSTMSLDASIHDNQTAPALTSLAQAYWKAKKPGDLKSMKGALPVSFLRDDNAADLATNTVFDPLWALQAIPSVRTMDQLFNSIKSLVIISIDSQENRELDILIETMISMCGAFKGGNELASFGELMHLLQTLRFLCQLLVRYPQDAPQLFLEKTYWSLFLQELLSVVDIPLSIVGSADMMNNIVTLSSDSQLHGQDDEVVLLFYYKCLLTDLLFITMDIAKACPHSLASPLRDSKVDMVVASTEVDVTSDYLRNQRFHGMEVWYCFQWLTIQHRGDLARATASGGQNWAQVLTKALQCMKILSKTRHVSTPFLASAKVAVMTFMATIMHTRPSDYWIEIFLDHEDRPDHHVLILEALHDPVCADLAARALLSLLKTWEDIEPDLLSRRPGRLREALAHDVLKRILKALRTRSESKRFYMFGVTNLITAIAAAVHSTQQVAALLESYGPARTVHTKMFCWTRSRSRFVKELLNAVNAAVRKSTDLVATDLQQDVSMVGAVINLISALTQRSGIFVDQLIKVTELDDDDSAIDSFRSTVIAVCTTDDQARYLFRLLFGMLLGHVTCRTADFDNCSEHFFENIIEPLVIVNSTAFLLLFIVLSMATDHLQSLVLHSLLFIFRNENVYYENLHAVTRSKPCLLILLTDHYDSLEKHGTLLSDIIIHILPAILRTHEHKYFMDTLLFSATQAAKDLLAKVVMQYTNMADKHAMFLLKGQGAVIEVPQALYTRASHYTVMAWIQIPNPQATRLSLKLFSAQHRVLFSVLQTSGLGIVVHMQHENNKLTLSLTCIDEIKSQRLCDTHTLDSFDFDHPDEWMFVAITLKPGGVISNSSVKIVINQTVVKRQITLPSVGSRGSNYLAIGGMHSLVNKSGLAHITGDQSTSDLFLSSVYVLRKGVHDAALTDIFSKGPTNFAQCIAQYTKDGRIAIHISPTNLSSISLLSNAIAICYPNSQRLLRDAVGLDSLFGFIQQACIIHADSAKVLEMFDLLHQVLRVLGANDEDGVVAAYMIGEGDRHMRRLIAAMEVKVVTSPLLDQVERWKDLFSGVVKDRWQAVVGSWSEEIRKAIG